MLGDIGEDRMAAHDTAHRRRGVQGARRFLNELTDGTKRTGNRFHGSGAHYQLLGE